MKRDDKAAKTRTDRFTSGLGTADGTRMTEAERDRAIRALRETYARGGLTHEEFDERLDAVFTARSPADLGELVAGHTGWIEAPPPGVTARAGDLDTVERHLSSGERIEWVG
jgi:hypothetical protein